MSDDEGLLREPHSSMTSSRVLLPKTEGNFAKIQVSPKDLSKNQPPVKAAPPPTQYASMSQYPPISIIPDAFPTNPFIISYLNCAWSNKTQIHRFYAPGSVLTITTDPLSTHPSIADYNQWSSNYLLGKHTSFDGPLQIQEALDAIFPNGFIAHPRALDQLVISDDKAVASIDGVFWGSRNCVLAFKRTFVIGFVENNFRISNDHVFIRDLSN